MATLSKRSTIYLDPALHQALRLKSVETSRSMSDIINEIVKEALAEDAEDLSAFDERASEPLISYEEMVKRLKKMAGYKIFFKKSVWKDFESIPKKELNRILLKIESLSENNRPSGSQKLSAQERYRIRQGRYRIIYSIQDDELTVWVVKVAHRQYAYR